MKTLTLEKIEDSYSRIKKYIIRTPLMKSIFLGDNNTEIYFKMENRQKLNCCKIRGAFAKLTSLDNMQKIVAVSSGNHGISVSYASKILGFNDTNIFLSKKTTEDKFKNISEYGPKINIEGIDYDDAHRLAEEFAYKSNAVFIDPCSDDIALAGQGTIAIEILEDLPDVDQIFIPVGGGGIFAGIALYAKSKNKNIKIIAVQTEMSPSFKDSIKDGKRYSDYPAKGESICDALLGGVGELPYSLIEEYLDDVLVVEEKYVKDAIRHLILKEKNVIEPAGAIGLAAYFMYPEVFKNRKNVIILSGGNIDEELLISILSENRKEEYE